MRWLVSAWAIVAGMSAWALYLYFAWSAAEALPMQWGLSGKPTWFAARGVAVGFFPLLALLAVVVMTFSKRDSSGGDQAFLSSALLLAIQAVWVFFARRYV